MILRFRHRGLRRLHLEGDASGVSAQHVKRLRLILAALETSSTPSDMALPGARLHPLSGEFEEQNVTNVDLVDYD
jgi:toxin HigB-1